ncbi:hypothetical protein Q9251_03020 [Alkalihalobacillus macyae]|uniref:hypothetical protein n=1 Tax=Guptibacillus hwajinpoensis TaxID=208199 RepID=UPI00273C7E3B|nr:hypothetical protein [Alkalihalobacillus macyae]MDP4549847.1 hypothetical protein [Alkalihalobacillus macyae]
MADKKLFRLGACSLEFGEDTEQVIIDSTKGGVQFTVESEVKEITDDQNGSTPRKTILKGRRAVIEVPMLEIDLKKIAAAMPNSKLTVHGSDPNKAKLEVYSEAGYDLSQDERKLVLKPDQSDEEWITFPLAQPSADINFTYDDDNERIANIKFMAMPQKTAEAKNLLYIIGDEGITGEETP